MDERRRLVSLVLSENWSVAAASRELGVSRPTAYLWLRRAQELGIGQMAEQSTRPKSSPNAIPLTQCAEFLRLAELYPQWGPRKIRSLIWPPEEEHLAAFSVRTAERLLARQGRRIRSRIETPDTQIHRFERELPNELWQSDFKILRKTYRRSRQDTMTLLDDASRFCLRAKPVENQTFEAWWEVFWDACGEYGMPEALLTDNGSAFRCSQTWRWSPLDLRLMLLGIRSLHGRPYHPQTQGKIERMHATLELELERTDPFHEALAAFQNRYNWERPHEALGMKTPGLCYLPSTRIRPNKLPEPFFPTGTQTRRACVLGKFSFKGQEYKAGRAFGSQPIGIAPDPEGNLHLAWAGTLLCPLEELRIN